MLRTDEVGRNKGDSRVRARGAQRVGPAAAFLGRHVWWLDGHLSQELPRLIHLDISPQDREGRDADDAEDNAGVTTAQARQLSIAGMRAAARRWPARGSLSASRLPSRQTQRGRPGACQGRGPIKEARAPLGCCCAQPVVEVDQRVAEPLLLMPPVGHLLPCHHVGRLHTGAGRWQTSPTTTFMLMRPHLPGSKCVDSARPRPPVQQRTDSPE